jgi:hypothetical protein
MFFGFDVSMNYFFLVKKSDCLQQFPMLATGLRIGDAPTISRERFVKDGDGWRVVLRTAKSGTSVTVSVQEKIVTFRGFPASTRSGLARKQPIIAVRFGRKCSANFSNIPG